MNDLIGNYLQLHLPCPAGSRIPDLYDHPIIEPGKRAFPVLPKGYYQNQTNEHRRGKTYKEYFEGGLHKNYPFLEIWQKRYSIGCSKLTG